MVQQVSLRVRTMLELGATALSIRALRAVVGRLEISEEGLGAIDGAIDDVLNEAPGALEALARQLVPIYISLSLKVQALGQQYAADLIAEVTDDLLVPEFDAMPDDLGDYLKTVFKAIVAAQRALVESLGEEQLAKELEDVAVIQAADSPYDELIERVEDEREIDVLHAMVMSTVITAGYQDGRECDVLVPMAEKAAADMIAFISLLEDRLERRIDIYADDTPAERGQRALRIIERMRDMWEDGEWEEFNRAVVGE